MATAHTLPTESSLIRRLPAKQENLAKHAMEHFANQRTSRR